MYYSIVLSDLGSDLFNGIFSWQFLQFIVAFISFFGFVLTSAVILILAERKVMGWMQDRLGPMHTGPWGLLQTVADVGKLLLKEDIHARKRTKHCSFWPHPYFWPRSSPPLPSYLSRLMWFSGHRSRHWYCLLCGDEFPRRDRRHHGWLEFQ